MVKATQGTQSTQHLLEFSAGISSSDLSHLSQFCQGLLMSRTDLCQGPFKTFVYQVWGLFLFHSEKLSSFVFLICTDYYTISFLLILVPQHRGLQGRIWPCSAAGNGNLCPAAAAGSLLFVVETIIQTQLYVLRLF